MLKEARHLARADYIAMPWRNRAGITHEIAREPAQGADFGWRLSLASLQVNGPFSPYAAYERCVALVAGRGFRLHIGGARVEELYTRGAYARFAGAAETRCELLDGPCLDLSLIVREPGMIDEVNRLSVSGEQDLKTPAARAVALFILRGSITAQSARHSGPASVVPLRLALHDTLLIPGGESWSLAAATAEPAEALLLSFAVP